MNNNLKLSLLSFLLLFIFIFPSFILTAEADETQNSGGGGTTATQDSGGGGDTTKPTTVKLTNPLPKNTTPQSLIGNIISAMMGIIGSIALAMFIYGGFTWMTAAGNSERVTKGKDILIWATLGLVAIFASYSIIKFLIGSIG